MHQYSLESSIQAQAEVLTMYLGPWPTEHTEGRTPHTLQYFTQQETAYAIVLSQDYKEAEVFL